jgi:hypothetical protein
MKRSATSPVSTGMFVTGIAIIIYLFSRLTAAFTPQGRCKPYAMELVPIAEAQPVLAAFRLQRYNFYFN